MSVYNKTLHVSHGELACACGEKQQEKYTYKTATVQEKGVKKIDK